MDTAFYHNLLVNRFRLLLNISQLLGFLPFPFHLQQQNGQKQQRFFIEFLKCLHKSIGMVMLGTAFTCCVTLYLYFPEIMYEEDVPPLLNIAYHLENALKVLIVLITLLWPQTSESFYREIYNDLVQILLLYGDVKQIDSVLVSITSQSRRFLFLYCFDALVNTVSLGFVLGHPVSTLLSMSYILPFIAIMMNVLQYNALFCLIGGIAAGLNDRLRVIAVEDSHHQRLYEKQKPKHCYPEDVKRLQHIKSQRNLPMIDKLSTLQVALMNLVASTNDHCGPVLVIIMLCSFVQTNVALFELYLNSDPLHKDPEMSDFIIWILFLHSATNFSYFVIMACCNRTIQKQNERTILILHDFNCFWDEEQNEMIEYYINQISNHPHIHKVCGMINLDMELIPNVVAAITSILFILMQFSDARSQDLLLHYAEQYPTENSIASNTTF